MTSSTTTTANGTAATRRTRSASPSSASATARAPSCRACSTTGRRPAERVPGLMHVDLGGYHISRHRVLGRVRHRRRQGRQGPLRGDLAGPEQHDQVRQEDVPHLGIPVQRGMTHDGLGKYLKEKITKAEGSTVDIVPGPQGHAHRRRRLLPPGRLRAGDQVVRRAGPRGRLRLRELHPGVHRPRGLLERPLHQGRAADHRRRHQVPGRRDDRPPHAGAPVRRPRRQAAAHVAAQRRRQHGLLQHARARAAGVQEDLQDQRRDLDHRGRAGAPRTSTSALRTTCRG